MERSPNAPAGGPRPLRRWPALLAACVAGAAGCATTPRPAQSPRLIACSYATTMGTDRPPEQREFPASYWFALLLAGYQSAGTFPAPVTDCGGRQVRLESDGCGAQPPAPAVPVERLSDRDLVIAQASETTRLVWVMAARAPDGQAEGPVALVDVTPRGLIVRAIGVLRGYSERVALRLAQVGSTTLLVAEGERCGPDGCVRGVRFIPRNGDQFVASTIRDDRGDCLGSTFVILTGSGVAPGSADRYHLETSVSFGTDDITLREQLTISPSPGRGGNRAPGFVRQVRSERRLRVQAGAIVASAADLLTRWREHASEGPEPATAGSN